MFYMNRKKIGKREEAASSWKVQAHNALVNHSLKTILNTIDELGWKLEVLVVILHGHALLALSRTHISETSLCSYMRCDCQVS